MKKQRKKRADRNTRSVRRRLTIRFMLWFFVVLAIVLVVFCGSIIALSQTGVLGDMDSFTKTLPVLFSAAVSLILGAGASFLFIRIPLKPLSRVIEGMRRLAAGHYEERLEPDRSTEQLLQLSETFNTLAEELQNTEMLRSDFINNFSHEFKTPIVSIAGFARILEHGGLTEEEEKEYLHIILVESARLSHMATNVLYMTKVENQSILTEVTEFNLSEQLRRCILLLEKKWEAKSLEIIADFQEHSLCANENLLKEVWINLLDNAIKFSPHHGDLTVKVVPERERIAVSIANQGPALLPEEERRMFDKFYQGDTSRASEGMGIGLSVVKKVVALHKGDIQVYSEPGNTVFTVILPRAE